MPVSNSKRQGGFLIICVLALLSIFPPLATDMYLSALDDVAAAFNASPAAAEMSLSVFFLGLCAGQLIVGPLIDAYGRKLPLLIGCAVFVVTSVGLLLVQDIYVFNALRFVQALGACAGMVVGRVIVNDLYDGRKAAQMLTILVMLMTLGPILAPFLGSLLFVAYGWQAIFIVLVLMGVLAFVLAGIIIPETLPQSRRREAAFGATLRRFVSIVSRSSFIAPAFVTACIQAPMFAFITASSGVFQGIYGMSSEAYGVTFGLIATALVVFGQLNRLLLNRFNPQQILTAMLPVFVFVALVLLVNAQASNMWLVVIPLWLALGLVGLLTANAMSIAMKGAIDHPGLASAAIGAIQFGLAFSTSTLVALAGTDSVFPMASAIFIAASLASVLWFRVGRFSQDLITASQQ